MAINKVIYDGRTLINLTDANITTTTVLSGWKGYGANGEIVEGECTFDVDSSDANATRDTILIDTHAYGNGQKIEGNMPNNHAVDGKISAWNGEYIVPQGYHDGSGRVSIDPVEQAKLRPANIRQGVSILGIDGNMTGTEAVITQKKSVTPKPVIQTIVADEGYYISEVTVEAIPYYEEPNSFGTTVTIG